MMILQNRVAQGNTVGSLLLLLVKTDNIVTLLLIIKLTKMKLFSRFYPSSQEFSQLEEEAVLLLLYLLSDGKDITDAQ